MSLRKRKISRVAWFAFLSSLLLPFQNCGKGFQVAELSSNSAAISSQSTPLIELTPSADLTTAASYQLQFQVSGVAKTNIKTVVCQLDTDLPVDCSANSITYSSLADGDHRILVTAVTTAGMQSQVTKLFRKDATAPSISVSSTPAVLTNQTAAAFNFSATDALSGLDRTECSVDSAPFTLCTSPKNLMALVAGSHVLKIRAFDKAGNPSVDFSFNWVIDLAAPTVTITQMPAAITNSKAAAFVYAGAGILSYECALDSAAFASCSSQQNYSALADGSHTFRVRGTNAAANVSAPSVFTWLIDSAVPAAPTVTSDVVGTTVSKSATISFSATAPSGIASYECSVNGASFAVCTSPLMLTQRPIGNNSVKVRAKNRAGTTSAEGLVSWVVMGPPTMITNLADASVYEGDTFSYFVISYTGTGISYEWSHNGVLLMSGAVATGGTIPALTVTAAQASDAGLYKLKIMNAAGFAEASATVTLKTDPIVITSEPAPTIILHCSENQTLSVAATGRSLQYYWTQNIASSSTNQLVLQASASGYDCRSGPAKLTITSGTQTVTRSYNVIRSLISVKSGTPTYIGEGSGNTQTFPAMNLSKLRAFSTPYIPQLVAVLADDQKCYFMNGYMISVPANCDGNSFHDIYPDKSSSTIYADNAGVFRFHWNWNSNAVERMTFANINYSRLKGVGGAQGNDIYMEDGANTFYYDRSGVRDLNGNLISAFLLPQMVGADRATLVAVDQHFGYDANRVFAGGTAVALDPKTVRFSGLYFAYDANKAFAFGTNYFKAPTELVGYTGVNLRLLAAEVVADNSVVYSMATNQSYSPTTTNFERLVGADAATFAWARSPAGANCTRFYKDRNKVYYREGTVGQQFAELPGADSATFTCDTVSAQTGTDQAATYALISGSYPSSFLRTPK